MSTFQSFVVLYFPGLLSLLTIIHMYVTGNKFRWTWIMGLVNQVLWCTWIISSHNWGFLVMNVALTIMYFRNHIKWEADRQNSAELFARHRSTAPTNGANTLSPP